MIRAFRSSSLQRRLSLLTAAVVALSILASGIGAYFLTRFSLYDQLDRELAEAAYATAEPVANDLENMGGLYATALRSANVTIAVIKADNTLSRVRGESVRLSLTGDELAVARLQEGWSHRSGTGEVLDERGQVLRTERYRIVAVPMTSTTTALTNPSIDGVELKLPIWSELASASKSWTDGKLTLSDITAPVDISLSILDTVLDPVAAVLGKIVDWAMRELMNRLPPVKKAVDDLLGVPDEITKVSDSWSKFSGELIAAGNDHVAAVRSISAWTGDGFNAYKEMQTRLNASFGASAGSCDVMAMAIRAAGMAVAYCRDTVWNLVKDFLTSVISKLAFAVTGPVFAGWVAAKIARLLGKIAKKIQTLMTFLRNIAKKFGIATTQIDKAYVALEKARKSLGKFAGKHAGKGGLDPQKHLPGSQNKRDFNKAFPKYGDAKKIYDRAKKAGDVLQPGFNGGVETL